MTMHSCGNSCLKTTCPICKINHNIKFESEFDRHNHYLTGVCPNCNYKIIFKESDFSSGTFVEEIMSGLEKKL